MTTVTPTHTFYLEAIQCLFLKKEKDVLFSQSEGFHPREMSKNVKLMFMRLEGGGLCCHFQDILDNLKMTTVTPHLLSSSHTVLVFEKRKRCFIFSE